MNEFIKKNKFSIIFYLLGLVLLFVDNYLWLGITILIIVSIFSLVKWGVNKLKKEKEKLKKGLITSADGYFDDVKKNKSLKEIKTSILLNEKEFAILEEDTNLKETRSVRSFSGGSSGLSFKVSKRLYVRGGNFGGTSESNQEWRVLDDGLLTLTNKRLIFRGKKGTRIIPLEEILFVQATLNSIQISIESKSKKVEFPVNNSYIWAGTINILHSVKDPLNLDGKNLNIKFE